MTLINLYITSSCREVIWARFIYKNVQVVMDFLFRKFCKKDKCSFGCWPAYSLIKSKYNFSTNFLFKKILFWHSNLIQKEPLELFYKKALRKTLEKFTGKHVCWSLLSCRLSGLLQDFYTHVWYSMYFRKNLLKISSTFYKLCSFMYVHRGVFKLSRTSTM